MNYITSPFNLVMLMHLGCGSGAFATEPAKYTDHHALFSSRQVVFVENKGQVRTLDGEPAPFVRYRMDQGNTVLFLLENGIAFQFNRWKAMPEEENGPDVLQPGMMAMEHPRSMELETYRMDMLLEGGNPHPRISAEGRSNDRTHYYNTGAAPALDVRSFARLTYHEVWPGIDWVIRATPQGMKYDFIVHPGADPALIRLRFKDHEDLAVDTQGRLIHGNRLGRFIEEAPVSFQGDTEIPTHFSLDGDLLHFSVGAYDKARSLTIDPARYWGTYFGGDGFDSFNFVELDAQGDLILGGQTTSSAGIATGGHQITIGGGSDSFLAKFDGDGVRQWATYFGGSDYETTTGGALDGSGAIYLCGSTTSSSGIAQDGHQLTYGGGIYDAFLAKFNMDGTLSWGTYYGGSGDDQSRNCTVDTEGNVYLVGATVSNSGIATGWFQGTRAGLDDGFVVKFGPDGERIWGSYYGGESDDTVRDCEVDTQGNVHLVGSTRSTTGIAENGHQMSYGGGGAWDGYVAKLDANGTRQWATYYGGSTGDELIRITLDGGEMYVCGAVSATANMAANGHQNTYGGGSYDAILVKFGPDGTRLWATYYGGSDFELGFHLSIDRSTTPHMVYMSGWSSSTTAMASNGFQDIYGGGTSDAYLAKFHSDGTRSWATYYGGALSEEGVACAVSPDGAVYQVGNTSSTSGIADNGFQNSYAGGTLDAYMVKLHGTATGIFSPADEDLATVIWPNPAGDVLWVGTGEEINAVARVLMRDAIGRLVLEKAKATPFRSGAFRVEIGHLIPGIYSVEVEVDARRWSGKFMKE